jgi:hypothetical protein
MGYRAGASSEQTKAQGITIEDITIKKEAV